LNLIRFVPAKGQDPMSTSVFLARLIGPVALVAAAAMLLNVAAYRAMAREFLRSPSLIYLSGLLTMTAGLAIVLSHNLWVADWRAILTIFGWLATVGGAARIAFPDKVRSIGESMLAKNMALYVGVGIWLAIGAVLCYFGYLR
jgi:hypothetical protein